ncbi:capsular biosynthesis protein [Pantoea stewartii]|uniref:capsular biosynthesis protein n=1 Tax=Pantoea stewartii TaxID=66269 RepID=UPI00197E7367|nr:capsular biosynthesis protein [Pantoea stewartii]
MIIILSAQYVDQDLRAEFGQLPPAFLPVGNKRLYTYQIKHIRDENKNEKIFLTLPKSFNMSSWDEKVLSELSVEIIRIDETFSLGQSIAFSLASSCSAEDEHVVIYYGDTLLRSPLNIDENNKDVIFTAHSDFNYSWMVMNNAFESNESVFCGILAISKPQLLIRNLISSKFELAESLVKYHETTPFSQQYREDWLDFGHLNTFYDSKTIVSTARAFNELTINKYYVEKRSVKKEKLQAEANWFSNIPEEMAYYAPMLISHGDEDEVYKYKLEYLYSPTLTELFVYGNHPKAIWAHIITSCFTFIEKCYEIPASSVDEDFYTSLVSKNESRLEEFTKDNPRYNKIIQDAEGNKFELKQMLHEMHDLISKESKSTFIHGDFCFSNILYDFKKNDIKVIDPRGIDFNGLLSIYGDIRYDLAKILHSAIGKYDYIISDRFIVNDDGLTLKLTIPDSSADLSDLVRKQFEKSAFSYKEILAITTTLFLSMLPLHYDRPDRQSAFVATAINLYKEVKK